MLAFPLSHVSMHMNENERSTKSSGTKTDPKFSDDPKFLVAMFEVKN